MVVHEHTHSQVEQDLIKVGGFLSNVLCVGESLAENYNDFPT